MAKKPTEKTETVGTKRSRLIRLLKREQGASLAEMVEATDWQPHTVRAALTGLRNQQMTIDSELVEGIRRYHILGDSA